MLFQECVSNAFQELLRFQIFMLYLLNYDYQNDDFWECFSLLGLLLDQTFSWLLTSVSDSLLSLFSMGPSLHAFFFFNYLVCECVCVCACTNVHTRAHTHKKQFSLGSIHSSGWWSYHPHFWLGHRNIYHPEFLHMLNVYFGITATSLLKSHISQRIWIPNCLATTQREFVKAGPYEHWETLKKSCKGF